MTLTIADAERRTRYTPSVATATFEVGFALVAAADVEVYLDGEVVSTDDYSVTLGDLADGFYSDATVVFTAGVTGTLDIVGKRPPSRTGQFTEGEPVSAEELNQEFNRHAVERREAYDRGIRTLALAPGSTVNPVLPAPVAGRIPQVSDDGTAIEWVTAGAQGPQGEQGEQGETGPQGPAGAGSGDVLGPGSSGTGNAATYADTGGTQLADAGAPPVLPAATQTLTNKRVTARVGSTASSATPTPSADDHDMYIVTALAETATFGAPTGTPTNGQKLTVRIKDDGTGRTLAWNAAYRALGNDLPTTTTASKTMYLGFIYNSADSKWDLVALAEQE